MTCRLCGGKTCLGECGDPAGIYFGVEQSRPENPIVIPALVLFALVAVLAGIAIYSRYF